MIITINSQGYYLESIANIISTLDQSRLKIIMPTTASCIRLQNILVKNSPNKSCILPNIAPIINIGIGSEDIYDIPSELIEPMSSLHQRILLSKIIQREDSNITFSGALDLSSHIMRLFSELTEHEISIDDLDNESLTDTLYDVADHWRYRTEFLKKIYDTWQKTLADYRKIDLSQYRKNILKLEIEAAKKNIYTQVLVGLFPNNPLMKELVEILVASKDSYFIPPPLDISKLEEYKNTISKTHYYYQLGKLSSLPGMCNMTKQSIMDWQVLAKATPHNEVYSTANNLREESDLITNKISSWLKEDSEAQIAIICKNNELINICHNLLNSQGISCININGYNLSKTKPFEFLILLIESYDTKHEVNLEKFITLLKTHYLFSEEAREFELNLRKSSNSIIASSSKATMKQSSSTYMDCFASLAMTNTSLKSYIALAEKLAPDIWSSLEGRCLSDFLYELLQIEDIEEYAKDNLVDFIKSVASGARFHKNIESEKVLFMGLEDASIGGYEYIIFADMNEGSIPTKISLDPWMNNKMRENLGLMDMSEKIGIEWYYFKNLLSRKKIYMTRSRKKNGSETLESRFIQELVSTGGIDVTS